MMEKTLKISDFTEDEIKRIRQAIYRTWDTIACDIDQIEGWRNTLAARVEVTLDADYIHMYGGIKDLYDKFNQMDYKQREKLAREVLR